MQCLAVCEHPHTPQMRQSSGPAYCWVGAGKSGLCSLKTPATALTGIPWLRVLSLFSKRRSLKVNCLLEFRCLTIPCVSHKLRPQVQLSVCAPHFKCALVGLAGQCPRSAPLARLLQQTVQQKPVAFEEPERSLWCLLRGPGG